MPKANNIPIIGAWYPATSLTTPSHSNYHQFLQASFAFSIKVSSTSIRINFPMRPQDKGRLKLVLMYLSILLIVQSSDIESNPGPRAPKYPCGVCGKAVRWSRTRTAVACDSCDTWYHCDCMCMSSSSYNNINKSNVTWICSSCDAHNFSTSLAASFTAESSNSFDSLSNLNPHSDHEVTQGHSISDSPRSNNLSNPGSPIVCSSPMKKSRRINTPQSLKILSANLQSLKAKREVFWEAVDSLEPDIIVANETWLKPDIHSGEVMPPGFNPPIRRDRPDGYGGVLLATKHNLVGNEIQLNTTSELVASKIELCHQQSLIVISGYRPTNNDLNYAQNFCHDLRLIASKFPTATLWLCGDLNLPDISWSDESILKHQYLKSINECFLSTFNDLGLSQIVNFSTRQESTLDVFLTNRPSLICSCIPVPGVTMIWS